MRRTNKLIALLLCLSLLSGLVGCTEEPVSTQPSGTVDSTAQTTAPTEPGPDNAAIYQDAAAAMSAKSDLSMTVSYTEEMTVGNETIPTSYAQQITHLGIGTDDLRVSVEETATYGAYETDITEIYVGGAAYANVYDTQFTSAMTAEEFCSRYIPVILIDAALYGSCELETVEDTTVLHFSDAAELESWLASEATTLIDAQADVTISAEGELLSVTYTANYKRAAAEVSAAITVTYSEPAVTNISAPANTSCTSLEYLDGPRVVEQTYGYLCSFCSLTFGSSITTYVPAANFYLGESYSFNTYDTGSALQAKVESNIYSMDYYTGESEEYKLEEIFKNNKYTASVNGGAAESNRSVTSELMSQYVLNALTEYIPDCSFFTNAVCTDLGSLLLIEFTGSSDLAEIILDEVCYDVFMDEELLGNYATAYRTETMDYYIAVDKYLGLPTSIGLIYEGTHTIDGYEYTTIRQVSQAIYMASLDSYEAINSVSAPDVEPEEKATPVFYHVTGSDGQEMWLLGTIHIGDSRTGYLPQEIYDAYNASDALAVECNTRAFDDMLDTDEDLQNTVSENYYYSDGSTTKDHVEDGELYELALKFMKATGNYFHNAAYMKVATWSSSIQNYFQQCSYGLSPDKGVDNRLLMMAEADGKKILEVESSLFQIQMLTGWSEELSNLLLEETVYTDALEYASSVQELYEMWCAGNEAELIEYLADDTSDLTEEELALYKEYNDAMSSDRNAGMVQVAIEYLESGETVFYAVGLAHVLAEDGLVNALREAGYTVELVQYN